jgi:hypothetical protein
MDVIHALGWIALALGMYLALRTMYTALQRLSRSELMRFVARTDRRAKLSVPADFLFLREALEVGFAAAVFCLAGVLVLMLLR